MDEHVVDWGEIADYWDQKQGDKGDLWHRALIDPTLLRLVGPVAGRRVLDLACGNGYLSRRLARQGARVTGVDGSISMIAKAQAWEQKEPLGTVYHAADAALLTMLEPGAFDIVVCNMAIMDISNAEGAITEVGRVLKAKGRFVASLPHPCFNGPGSAWVVERSGVVITVSRKVVHYREPAVNLDYWRVTPDRLWYTRDYHRPLSWYVRALVAAGLAVTALEEPEPTEEFMQNDTKGPWVQQVPLHCVWEAVKM